MISKEFETLALDHTSFTGRYRERRGGGGEVTHPGKIGEEIDISEVRSETGPNIWLWTSYKFPTKMASFTLPGYPDMVFVEWEIRYRHLPSDTATRQSRLQTSPTS